MRASVIAAAILVTAAGYVAARSYAGQVKEAAEAAGQEADGDPVVDVVNVIDDAASVITEGYLMPVSMDVGNSNLQAFLGMIRYCEGTAGPEGYRTLVGGGLLDSLEDHPRQVITITSGGRQIKSSAAGAYQFLAGTWDEVSTALGLTDFSPASQDIAAAYLIRRRGALGDVYAGRINDAVRKCAKEWASLPGSPYGQPVKTLSEVRRVYVASGGSIQGGNTYA